MRAITKDFLTLHSSLTARYKWPIPILIMKHGLSTVEVARVIGVDKSTLLRWLYAGKLPEPKQETFGGVESRVWSEADLKRAKDYRERLYYKHPQTKRAR